MAFLIMKETLSLTLSFFLHPFSLELPILIGGLIGVFLLYKRNID